MDYFGQTIESQPCADWKAIQAECAKHPQFVVRVESYSEEREITRQQYAYLHSLVFPTLAKVWDTSLEDAEFECKKRWGEQWLIKKSLGYRFVLSKTTLTVKQCNKWLENIWQGAHREGIIISPPDKDWRETARKMAELRGTDGSAKP
jgi:hypothetical protein